MTDRHRDIDDTEIRIISSQEVGRPAKRGGATRLWLVILAVALAACVVAILFFVSGKSSPETASTPSEEVLRPALPDDNTDGQSDTIIAAKGFTCVTDTTVNGRGLTILTPRNAAPALAVGPEALADSTIVLACQAADVRADNGRIAGTYILGGELLSKGEAKAGFGAIINGALTIGVADATPLLEQALETGGFFFRQYPLVVGGQIVENRPKGRSIRKALAETDGHISVIVSRERLTFHDFSQALVDAGVRNAIYLVGSESACTYLDADGRRHTFNTRAQSAGENINFIVWR